VNLFVSMMRADITMIETYEYKHEAPLDCGITAYGGLQDISVDEDNLTAWREQTTAGFDCRMFPGEHFFIQSARTGVIWNMNNQFSEYLKEYNTEGTE
jgi:medium-chain acyl-[acyl-carrier-protein] hydrolase